MTTVNAKVGYMLVGVLLGALLTVLALWSVLKETKREQRWGLLLSPEEVKSTCGNPQTDNMSTLTYVEKDSHVELQFYRSAHQMFLSHVKYSSGRGSGEIFTVTEKEISDAVANGWLPACVGLAAQ